MEVGAMNNIAEDGNHYPFITLRESVRLNALRHQANGDRYVREGMPDYALGSYRKAQKNFERAESFSNVGCAMTELERARAHLREAQEFLGRVRLNMDRYGPNLMPGIPETLKRAECCVLAALSWVWSEQQRERQVLLGIIKCIWDAKDYRKAKRYLDKQFTA
jgi:hypothetical protein